jgi:uncharacterized protein (DUF2267 family)
VLPVCLRALFVTDWDLDEPSKPFADRETMLKEVRSLLPEHNFSTETAIQDVTKAVRKHLNIEDFDALLGKLPQSAVDFWQI